MKNLDEVKVSVYTSVHAKKNDAVTLFAVLAAIKNGKVKDVVWAARRYWADGDSKAVYANLAKEICGESFTREELNLQIYKFPAIRL